MISSTGTVLAIAYGTVVAAGKTEEFGNFVIIEYRYENLPPEVREALGLQPGQSMYVQYQHLANGSIPADKIYPGATVTAGQVVGAMGNTGIVTKTATDDGTHLHLEIHIGASDAFGSKWGGGLDNNTFYDSTTFWKSTGGKAWEQSLTIVDPGLIWPALPQWKW
jgi:murein DD-endopeptidase MepM/ murein hydrolase activator NlpD